MHFIYILRGVDGTLYIGETADLDLLLEKHQDGSASALTASRPLSLAYTETHPTHAAAPRRERQLKRWTRGKKEALIADDVALLKQR